METGEAPITIEEKQLTVKQRKFADLYVGSCNLNATRAAIAAGYSEKTAYSIGHENLRKPEIRFYIEKRLSEITLSRNEVLMRLTRIASGSVEDLLDDDGKFDFKTAKRSGKLALIKKLKVKPLQGKAETNIDSESPETTHPETFEEVEFEMYSAHEALRDLGKYHKLFIERHEVKSTVSAYIMTKEEWERDTNRKLGEVQDQVDKFDE
jgi:phage terminase small subunit